MGWRLPMQMKENWTDIKKLFGQAFRSSFHYALATVNEYGEVGRVLGEGG